MRTTRATMGTSGDAAIDRIQRFLASDAGRRLRRAVSTVLLIGTPLLMRLPILRRHPFLRWVELLGGVALIARVATVLRDWEPDTAIRRDVE